jgi:hypothetical protein
MGSKDGGGGFGNELDGSFRPCFASSKHPTVIFEIAYLNESMPMLKCILHAWVTGPSVTQYAIGLKIFSREAPWRLKVRLIY